MSILKGGERHLFAGLVSGERADSRSRVVRVVGVARVVGVVVEASSATTKLVDSATLVLQQVGPDTTQKKNYTLSRA